MDIFLISYLEGYQIDKLHLTSRILRCRFIENHTVSDLKSYGQYFINCPVKGELNLLRHLYK